MKTMIRFALLAVLSVLPAGVYGDEPAPASLNVFPADIHLSAVRDRQLLLVQAVLPNGLTVDVTEKAELKLENEGLLRREGTTFYPVADGTTKLTVSYGGKSVEVPVVVQNCQVDPPVSFRLDVMPVFMKTSCNNGSCHGAARGKDGFRLSLFGFDPEGDHFRLTREIPGRRINLALPAESLLMEKGAGQVPHTGGKRFEVGSEHYNTVLRWLAAGAPNDPGPTPAVLSVEIYPKEVVLDGEGATQKLMVRAKYADGTDRDVTSLAYFSSNNENSAEIAQAGLVTAHARGEAFIMARFETHTVGSHFIVLPKGLQYEDPKTPENNYVDTLVNAKLRKLRIVPSELCTDEEFLRRVSLDITGTMPTMSEYDSFIADTDPQKRDKLVDALLQRKEFVDMWVMKWAELLQVRTIANRVEKKPMLAYYNWLKDRIASNTPTDKMVQELLSARGGSFSSPATNYYQTETETLKVSGNVAQVFMGMRMQCAQCHNHPFDRWTMDDYYGFAAFFGKVGRKTDPEAARRGRKEDVIFTAKGGGVNHPKTGKSMEPKGLGESSIADISTGEDPREKLVDWMADTKNPFFAPALVNLYWAHFFDRGLAEPIDDMRDTNPASNPELMQGISQFFIESGYDIKKLVRLICTSRTYGLSSEPNTHNQNDRQSFARHYPKRMPAEVLLDAVSQLTAVPTAFGGFPAGTRAIDLPDDAIGFTFLQTFGRPERDTSCECERVGDASLSQSLMLLNSPEVQAKLTAANGRAEQLAKDTRPDESKLADLFWAAYSRAPLPDEIQTAKGFIASKAPEKRKEAWEDILWALINAKEFQFVD